MYLPIAGIRSTRDSRWRENSFSTRDNCSRTGSKILESSSTLSVGGFTLWDIIWLSGIRGKQPGGVGRDDLAGLGGRNAFDTRQGRQRFHHPGRLVSLAAVRYGGQKRRIRLDQQPVDRHDRRRFAQRLR